MVESSSARVRILCVDDDPRILKGLDRQLQTYYDVLTAESGESGLEILEEYDDIAVVIADLRMPEMDGIEFLRHTQNLSPDTIRVVLTGHGEVLALRTALQNQLIFRVLDKPCSTRTLLETIQAALALRAEGPR